MSNVVRVEVNGQDKYLELDSDVLAIVLGACDDTISSLLSERKEAFEIAQKAKSNSSRYLKLKKFTKICDSYINNKKLKNDFQNPVTNAYIFEY